MIIKLNYLQLSLHKFFINALWVQLNNLQSTFWNEIARTCLPSENQDDSPWVNTTLKTASPCYLSINSLCKCWPPERTPSDSSHSQAACCIPLSAAGMPLSEKKHQLEKRTKRPASQDS